MTRQLFCAPAEQVWPHARMRTIRFTQVRMPARSVRVAIERQGLPGSQIQAIVLDVSPASPQASANATGASKDACSPPLGFNVR